MPIKSLSQSSLLSFQKYSSLLAGNTAYEPPALAFDLLATELISTNTSSVVFNNLVSSYGSDYEHLQLRLLLKTDQDNNNLSTARIDINGTTGSFYGHELLGTGAGVQGSNTGSTTEVRLPSSSTKAQGSVNGFGATVLDIFDPFNTNKNTTFRGLSGAFSSGADNISLLSSGFFSVDAINSMEIYVPAASWVSGCRFSLYGIKAA